MTSKGKKPPVKPIRIQRSRQHKMVSPNGLPIVCVSRPSKWGNPYKIGVPFSMSIAGGGYDGKEKGFVFDADSAVLFYKINLSFELMDAAKKELKGKNLACWCALVDKNGKKVPCHANILLQIANEL